MENIYHADDRYSNFLEGKVKELKVEKSQSFLAICLEFLQIAGRASCRQLTGIPPTKIIPDLIPVMDMEVIPVTTPPASSETE